MGSIAAEIKAFYLPSGDITKQIYGVERAIDKVPCTPINCGW
jgi:hypothetical protein